MSTIQVTIRCPASSGGDNLETVEASVGEGDLAGLVAGLEKVRHETNAALTKHVEQSRQDKANDQDFENDYMEQDHDDDDDDEAVPNSKKAKPDKP